MEKLSDAEQQRLRPIVPALRGLSALQRGHTSSPSGRGLATAPSRLRRAASLPFLPSIQSVRRSMAGLLSSRRASRSGEGADIREARGSGGELPELGRHVVRQTGGSIKAPRLEDAAAEEGPHARRDEICLSRLPRHQELEYVTDALVREVYQEPLSRELRRDIQAACPEVDWLAECILQCPLPANWRKVWRPCKDACMREPVYVGPEGIFSDTPPQLSHFVSLAWCIIWARLRPTCAKQMAKQLGDKTRDLGRKVRSLRECWTGPLLDPASHEEFFYCGAAGIRVSQNPCQELNFVLRCAEQLQSSGAFPIMPFGVAEEENTRQDIAESQAGRAEVSKSRGSRGPVCEEATRPVQQLRSRSTGADCKSVSVDVDAVRGCAAKCLQKPQAVGAGRALPLRFCPPTRQFQVERQQTDRLDQLCSDLAGAQAKAALLMRRRAAVLPPALPKR
ncbi:pgk-1 [Symbiodinium necroappetens]|uniref:Pgk-1 protein n=1 Tax=Symbiodinium necroappetens TaxID=1628268 RepID=A0A813CFT7_9DINO|nr:pgk-1 [Symbiodinium necroappetens]